VLLIDVPLPMDDLPPTPEGPGDRFAFAETAHRALLVIVREFNRLVAPMVTQLDLA